MKAGRKQRYVARNNDIENKKIAIKVLKTYFEEDPSIKHIKKKFSTKYMPSTLYKTTEEFEKLYNEIDTKAALGFKKISPKSINLAERILAPSLSKKINISISKVYPNEANCLLLIKKQQTKVLF